MDTCVNCGQDMLPVTDADPNGDLGCVCAQCRAEECHDYDLEPNVVFGRNGRRIGE